MSETISSEVKVSDPKNTEKIIYISIGLVCLFVGTYMLMGNKKTHCEDEEDEEYYKERYELSPPKKQNILKSSLPTSLTSQSTFCTCGGGIMHKNCTDPASRVNSYNNGLNEQTKFQNKKWGVAMPYDNFSKKL